MASADGMSRALPNRTSTGWSSRVSALRRIAGSIRQVAGRPAQVRFLVEEEAGRCFVRLQQQHVPGIAMLRYGSLRFDLSEGVTRQDAEEIADLLNRKVHSIVYAGEDLVEERSMAEHH